MTMIRIVVLSMSPSLKLPSITPIRSTTQCHCLLPKEAGLPPGRMAALDRAYTDRFGWMGMGCGRQIRNSQAA